MSICFSSKSLTRSPDLVQHRRHRSGSHHAGGSGRAPFRLKLPHRSRLLRAALLLGAGFFYLLHAVHLGADFPNNSPWMDWSKYTDEGWYGDAAIRHFQLGHWYVPGDFNPAAALPVWPLLEAMVFRFTGVSVLAARGLTVAVFGGILVASYLLIERWSPVRPAATHTSRRVSYAGAAAVFLLAVSPFCFVFTRLAILEPTLILLTLLALLTVGGIDRDETDESPNRMSGLEALRRDAALNSKAIVALGILLPTIVLTKTTGVFLFPAIVFLLSARLGYRLGPTLRTLLPAGLLGLLLWGGYLLLLVRPHFLLDYRYIFSVNAYTGITLDNFADVVLGTLRDGMWMGPIFYPVALLAIAIALLRARTLRAHPLIPTLILWAVGYTAFLAYHANLQPRYYLVVAVPLTMLIPEVIEVFVLPRSRRQHVPRPLRTAAVITCLAAMIFLDAVQTLDFVRHPEYTLLNAARGVNDYIAADRRRDPTHNPLVLSISGSDLSLMTGLPSICDDFGTLDLAERVKAYRPGWYVAWNEIDDDKMDALTPLFHLERVASFPAMDDPDRNLMILYRLNPATPSAPTSRRRKPIPRRLRTAIGQQPSTSQLEH